MSKSVFKKISPKVIVCSLLVGALASMGGLYFSKGEKGSASSNRLINDSFALIKSSKLRVFFNKVQKNPKLKDEYLSEIGPLTPSELNQGYLAAVSTFQYDLAIDFYELGAKNCYKEGEDILLIAIHSGRLDLVNDLLTPQYPLKLYHLNAARSLVNIEQSNWAFIYKKQDTDDLGYQKYLIQSQKLASEIIASYKAQNPTEAMAYESTPTHLQNYIHLFGENCQADFEKELQQTLKGDYTIVPAVHGTQRTPVLVDESGRSVGIIKTKNEILAQALDYDHFAGVPPAAEIYLPQRGNVVVQKWVADSVMATEYKREKEWNSEQLHHIRVLDIRLGNSDRNKGNVLIAKQNDQKHIIPIDHDLIMHYIPNDSNWEAGYLNAPFSPISKKYIQKLDLEKDAQIMTELDFKSEDILSMKIRTTLLKMATEHNLTLKETDMLFRFYYFDFLEQAEPLSASSTENEFRDRFRPKMEEVSMIVQNPVQVWGLIGNNFELYI